jgi:hypothetical protein
MATSRIVFYDSPNAPRNSRVERGFSVSSHQSSSASASSGGSAATSRWCWKDKRSRRRDVSKSLATRAVARQLSYAGPTSITIPILVAVVPVPVASWLLNPFGSLRRSRPRTNQYGRLRTPPFGQPHTPSARPASCPAFRPTS